MASKIDTNLSSNSSGIIKSRPSRPTFAPKLTGIAEKISSSSGIESSPGSISALSGIVEKTSSEEVGFSTPLKSPPKQPSFKPTLGGISEMSFSTPLKSPPKQPSFKPSLGGISEMSFSTPLKSPPKQPSFKPMLGGIVEKSSSVLDSSITSSFSSSPVTPTTPTTPITPVTPIVTKVLPTEIQGKTGTLTGTQVQNLRDIYDVGFPQSGFSFDRDSGETYRILYRGCTAEQLITMTSTGSAGGVTAREDTPKPTETEARLQVGELASFPEFTTDLDIARRFGTNNYVIAVKINNKYLTRGSVTERGHICNKSAPIELLAWEQGRTMTTS